MAVFDQRFLALTDYLIQLCDYRIRTGHDHPRPRPFEEYLRDWKRWQRALRRRT